MSVISADQAIAARIRDKTQQMLQRAAGLCAAHRVALPDPVIRFDLRGQAAGQARWCSSERPTLRYNLDIARRHEFDFLERTVAHEVAHLITAACHGRTRPHGAEWRSVMAYFGIPDASRCHDYALEGIRVKRQRRWDYRCGCSTHELSTTRHKRMLAGTARYHCPRCRRALQPVCSGADWQP
jgi:SprT protein